MLGYEGRGRYNTVDDQGNFTQRSYLDTVYVGASACQVLQTRILSGEYDKKGRLLPLGPCKDKDARRFASDHAAISLIIDVFEPAPKRARKN